MVRPDTVRFGLAKTEEPVKRLRFHSESVGHEKTGREGLYFQYRCVAEVVNGWFDSGFQ